MENPIIVEKREKYIYIKPEVENLNNQVSPTLKAVFVDLAKKGEKNFIVDLHQVDYCDSSGLSALLTGNRLSQENNGSFILANVNPHVMKLIMISQLDNVLKHTPTVNEAEDMLYMEELERDLNIDLDELDFE
jgi:anti-anti-sigma factor